jgi:hypothetical protein
MTAEEHILQMMKEFPLGTRMSKVSGSEWAGPVTGYYSTKLTPRGLNIESELHAGSVQLYPVKALVRL